MGWLDTTGQILDRCMDTFGEPITYTPKSGSPLETVGIFDNEYQAVDPNTGAIITSLEPVLGVKNANIGQTPRQDDTVLVRGKSYRVKEVQSDGSGGSRLFLHVI